MLDVIWTQPYLIAAAGGVPRVDPRGDVPGAEQAGEIVGGIVFFALIFTLVGVVLSAGLWAVGAFSNNYNQSINGKRGFLVCAAAALMIGAATPLLNYFLDLGRGVDGGVNG